MATRTLLELLNDRACLDASARTRHFGRDPKQAIGRDFTIDGQVLVSRLLPPLAALALRALAEFGSSSCACFAPPIKPLGLTHDGYT